MSQRDRWTPRHSARSTAPASSAPKACVGEPSAKMEMLEGRVLMTTSGSTASTYVSDLPYTTVANGWGPVERDMSNGEQAAGDGHAITLRGGAYIKGLGVHASSEVNVKLNGQYATFESDIGVDDETKGRGSVDFQVFADGIKLYDSGVLTGTSPIVHANVNVAGRNLLQLIVVDAGDGNHNDHADWAGAQLLLNGPAPAAPSGVTAVSGSRQVTLNWNASSGATGYNIYRGTTPKGESGTPINPTPISATTFTDSGLQAGQTYYYSIQAVSLTGSSTLSSETSTAVSAGTLAATLVPIGIEQGTNYVGPVARFTDTDTAASAADFSATITWDDGTTTAGTITALASGGFEVGGSHTFSLGGDRPLTVSINAASGAAASVSGTAQVLGTELSAATQTVTATEGVLFNGPLLHFSDVNPQTGTGNFTGSITWDDGTSSNGIISKAPGGGFLVSDSHLFLHGGNKPVTVSVKSASGVTISVLENAQVANASINATGVAASATAGSAFNGTIASFSDVNASAVAGDFNALITWGDGDTSAGQIISTGAGTFTVAGVHTFSTAGSYPLGITIRGAGGAIVPVQATTTVTGLVGTPQVGGSGLVAGLTGPLAAVVGGMKTKATVTLTLADQGNTPISGSVAIKLFASTDQTLDAGDMQLPPTVIRKLRLKVGTQKAIRLRLGSIPAIAAGTYDLLAQVTPTGGVATVAVAGQPLLIR